MEGEVTIKGIKNILKNNNKEHNRNKDKNTVIFFWTSNFDINVIEILSFHVFGASILTDSFWEEVISTSPFWGDVWDFFFCC